MLLEPKTKKKLSEFYQQRSRGNLNYVQFNKKWLQMNFIKGVLDGFQILKDQIKP